MDDGQSLPIDCVDICPVLFQQHSKINVAPEDGIMDTGEALVILMIKPNPFALGGVAVRVS